METGSTRVYVVRRPDGLWEARETTGGPVLGRADTRRDTLRRSRLALESGRGGEVVVLAADGSIQAVLAVEPYRQPRWWYVRPGAWRWLMPSLWAFQLVLRLMGQSPGALEVFFEVGLAVALVLNVVASAKSGALDRRRDPVEEDIA